MNISAKGRNNIALIGFKSSGKSRIGKLLAKKLKIAFFDMDKLIEDEHVSGGKPPMKVRGIYKKFGREQFLKLEAKALEKAAKKQGAVLSFGGGAPMNESFGKADFKKTKFVYLDVEPSVLFERIKQKDFPPFFEKSNPRKSFDRLFGERKPVYESLADITVGSTRKMPSEVCREIMEKLEA